MMIRIKESLGIAVLLIIAVGSMLVLHLAQQGTGIKAVIEVDGSVYKQVKLTENRTMHIELKNHHGVDIVVADGKVHVEHSTCPDGICEKMGEIGSPEETIVCLPNKVLIYVQ